MRVTQIRGNMDEGNYRSRRENYGQIQFESVNTYTDFLRVIAYYFERPLKRSFLFFLILASCHLLLRSTWFDPRFDQLMLSFK